MKFEDIEEYLALPYVAVFYSIENDQGEWVRRAEYPDLGCVIESVSQPDLMERLEDERVRAIVSMCERGFEPPRLGAPIRNGFSGLSELPIDQLFRRATGLPA